jgi:protein-tyrosine kinase
MSIIERAVGRLKTAEATNAPRQIEFIENRAPAPQTPSPRAAPPRSVVDREVESKRTPVPGSTRMPPTEGPKTEIDLAKLERAGMILPGARRTQISEEFRAIKRVLLQVAKHADSGRTRSNNMVLVTSAFPNEGKTFSSINLALSMSLELDHSVLLVDADVARAERVDFLGLNSGIGLMDLLLKPETPLEEAVIRTNIDRLDVLLAGSPQQHAGELLASESMSRLLDRLSAQGPERIVILDGPPLLVTTEARTLANRVGRVVLVVEADRTPQAALKAAVAQLEGCSVYALLNKSSGGLSRDMFRYGSYKYGA